MVNKTNVKSEFELYEPMRLWLQEYLESKHKNAEIITIDSHNERLDRVLNNLGIFNDMATGIDIQIDVLGVVKNKNAISLFFIEAKKTSLTLKDLGQLWAYCKLIDPQEAFLMTSADLGSLNKILNVFKREDLLDFGDNKNIKKMRIVVWNVSTNSPDMNSMIPKL
ncbi:MAG: hypothetical protein FWF92_06455 [Oscillospiraceae bacterium]|nr:hypothetical protein [Oscillospiraceae bacterium]